jgi:glutathione S-transferase
MRLRVHRAPFSTNVERIALAAAYKGVGVEWIDHDPADRSTLIAISGQQLVPVAEFPDGEIISDSPVILARLDELVPFPRLWPSDAARRVEVDVFVQWFNRVWKVPPNAIDASRQSGSPDEAAIAGWRSEIHGWLPWFEALLTDREHLMSDEFGIADVVAFPFLKFASGAHEDDDDLFHGILTTELALGSGHPRLKDWIARVDAMPQA